jgi:beta-aspartyl-peptidase (threonine type)
MAHAAAIAGGVGSLVTCVRASWSAGSSNFSVLVHGGAGAREGEETRNEGCITAAASAARILEAGGSALDAVEAAVVILEDDPQYNAGIGAALTEEGDVQLDAAIMEGRALRTGAVCALRHHRNAIRVARAVLEEGRHVFYAAEGARAFARLAGIAEVPPESLVTEAAKGRLARFLSGRAAGDGGNTVGAVARDRHGDVAAATSTGGITGKRSGRIGDSPVIGAGTHAENGRGAASVTGPGENILRLTLAFRATLALFAGQPPEAAARAVLSELHDRLGAAGGIILAGAGGELGLARTTESMPWAARWDGGDANGI